MEVLRTPRLRLRWFTEHDAPFVLELLNEPAWIENISDAGVRDIPQAQGWIRERLIANYWRLGHGFWAVERLADGALLGLCGIFKREGLEHPDVGYGFLTRHGGQGYAREAAAACLRYANEVLGMRRVQAITSASNVRSAHLLARLGMQDCGLQSIEGYEHPERLFDWQDPTPLPDEAAQIDALAARFFSAFDNRAGRTPTLAALAYFMLPSATVHWTDGGVVKVMSVREFIEPRAALLTEGRLTEFGEWELEQRTDIRGPLAQRWLRYEKRGLLDGQPCGGRGTKTLQLLRRQTGWKIAALSWVDDA